PPGRLPGVQRRGWNNRLAGHWLAAVADICPEMRRPRGPQAVQCHAGWAKVYRRANGIKPGAWTGYNPYAKGGNIRGCLFSLKMRTIAELTDNLWSDGNSV